MLFRSPPLRRATEVALLAAIAAGAAACNSQTTTTTGTTDDSDSSTVALIVRPADFLGDTPCSAAPGAMRSYVATLTDRTDPDVPFTFPSSLPTACSQGVRFDDITAGHSYSVQIDGYEAFSDEIGPPGWVRTSGDQQGTIDYKALRSGARRMTAADGTSVAPRWVGACGEGAEPRTIAAATGTTAITACDSLVDTAPGSTGTFVQVAPQDALGTLRCAKDADPGEPAVASFDLAPQNGLPGKIGIPCVDPPFVQTYPEVPDAPGVQLVPGTRVDFLVDAHADPNGPVVWGATCSVLVEEGLTVRAACSPLSDRGSLRIDVASLLDLVGVACSGDITQYDAKLLTGDVMLAQQGLSCTKDATFGPLAPGDYAADVALLGKDGAPLFTFACAAAVAPGRAATADCTLQ